MTRNLTERVVLETNELGFQIDYNNEISALYGILMMIGTPLEQTYRKGADLSQEDYILARLSGIKTYTEYFPLSVYEYPITPQVELVDAYAKEINSLLGEESRDYQMLHHLVNQIYFLTSGKKLP